MARLTLLTLCASAFLLAVPAAAGAQLAPDPGCMIEPWECVPPEVPVPPEDPVPCVQEVGAPCSGEDPLPCLIEPSYCEEGEEEGEGSEDEECSIEPLECSEDPESEPGASKRAPAASAPTVIRCHRGKVRRGNRCVRKHAHRHPPKR